MDRNCTFKNLTSSNRFHIRRRFCTTFNVFNPRRAKGLPVRSTRGFVRRFGGNRFRAGNLRRDNGLRTSCSSTCGSRQAKRFLIIRYVAIDPMICFLGTNGKECRYFASNASRGVVTDVDFFSTASNVQVGGTNFSLGRYRLVNYRFKFSTRGRLTRSL